MRQPKKTLVTGASRGIGKATALELARRGHEIGLHFHQQRDEAEAVQEIIVREGGKCSLFEADLADPVQAEQLGTEAWEIMNGLDVLINNAGVSYKKHVLDITPEDLDLFYKINTKGTFLLTQTLARKMVQTGTEGSIYTITSVNAIRPGMGLSAYGASKSALETLMQGLALELAPHAINVNTLAVGAIRTTINATVWENPGLLASVNEGIPVKRFGEPEEIAAVIASLLESGSYMTGSTIVIDGGLLLMRGYGKPGKYPSP